MSKKLSTDGCCKKWYMLLLALLLGIGAMQAAIVPMTLGTSFAPGQNHNSYQATEDGYLTLTFDSPVDMTGNCGVFFTMAGSYEDLVQTAVACNGTPAGQGTVYLCGNYEQYTGLTKVSYQVKSGVTYCVFANTFTLPDCTATFSTTLPDFGGGNEGPTGEEMGKFETGFQYVKVTPPSNGYILITFDSSVDMTGAYGIFYTCAPFGADITIAALETNGTYVGEGNVSGYGPYKEYTGVTKALYEVTGGSDYCVWNSPAAGSITFYTEKPSLDGSGGGSDNPQPAKKVIYVCDNTQYKDPSEPLVVELGDDGNYTFNLPLTSGIRMSTTKSNNTSWNGFEEGEFNMYAGEAADRKVAENMLGRTIKLWQGAEEYGPAGWLYLPWIGDYTGVIPENLATITLTTSTPKPETNYPLTDPAEGNVEAFGGVILMWADDDVVVALPEKIYITNPDPNGENLTVDNGAIEVTFTKLEGGGAFAEGDEIYGNVIAIDLNPESEFYDQATSAIKNPLPTPAEINVVLPAGAVAINDVPTEEDIVRTFNIPAGTVDPEKTPVGRIIVPLPDCQSMTGFQWVYSTYAEDGTWLTDYLPLELNEAYVNPNGKSYPEATVSVPNSTSTFQYKILISDNKPKEEPGYNGPADKEKQVDNTAMLQNFLYKDFGIMNTWQKEGDYKVTVPAGVFWITLLDEDGNEAGKVLNPESTLVYHCIGQHSLASYATLKAPAYTKYVPEVTADTDFGTVELDGDVIVSWATYTKNDVPTPLTLGTAKATVSLNGAPAVEVPTELLAHWSDNLVNGQNFNDPGLKLDLSQFNGEAGTYVVTLPEGIVYSEETDFQNDLYNMAQKLTFEATAPNTNLVTFDFEADADIISSGDIKMFGAYDEAKGGYDFLQKIDSTPVEFKPESYPATVNFAAVGHEDLVFTASSADAPAGSWSFEQAPAGSWKFDEGNGTHTAVWTLTIQEAANDATFTLTLAEEAGAEFKSMDPANEALVALNDNGTVSFSIEFTGDVEIERATAGMRGNFQLAVEPASGFASKFTFTFPKSYIDDLLLGYQPGENPMIFGNVYAKDKDGNYVSNTDTDDININYFLDVELIYGVDFNVTVAATAVEELSTFDVAPLEGYVRIEPYDNADPTETDTFYGITITNDKDFFAKAIGFENGVVTFNPAITESGSYTINFPFHAFEITAAEGTGSADDDTQAPDEGDKVYNSQEKTYPFTVEITKEGETTPGYTGTLPIDVVFNGENQTEYTFTPAADGELSMIKTGRGLYIEYLAPLITDNSEGVAPSWQNDAIATEVKWDLKGGTTYVFRLPVNWDSDELGTLFFTWTSSGEEPVVPNAVIFSFTGVDSAEQFVQLRDLSDQESDDPVVVITANPFELEFAEQFAVTLNAVDGYKISSITCENGVDSNFQLMPPANDDDETGDSMGAPVWMIFGGEAANGYIFNVAVAQKEEEPTPGYTGTLPIDVVFDAQNKTEYTFTPDSDGELSMTKTGRGLYIEYLAPLITDNGEGVAPSWQNDAIANEVKWDLKGGTTYVFRLPVDWDSEELGTLFFTWTSSGSTPEPALPAVLYVGNQKTNGSPVTTSSSDIKLVRNEETGLYEGEILGWPVKAGGLNYNAKAFYSVEGGVTTYYGRKGSDSLQQLKFETEGQTLEFTVEDNATANLVHGWYLNSTLPNPSYDVKISVDLVNMTASFTWEAEQAPDVDFMDYTVTPDDLNVEPGIQEFWGATITWNYPVKILDASKIYLQCPDGKTLTGEDGLSVKAQGNSLVIDVIGGPVANYSAYQAWTNLGVENGGITVNAQTLETDLNGIMVQITWAPVGIEIPDPTTVPAWGSTATVTTIDEIIMSWEGFYVASDTGNKDLSNLDDDIFIYSGSSKLGKYYEGATGFEKISVTVEGVGTPVNDFYPSVKITPSQTLDNPDNWYTLYIPAYNLLFSQDPASGNSMSQNDVIDLVYAVKGQEGMIVLPGQYQSVPFADWKGLQLKNAKGVKCTDPEKVAVFEGYPMSAKEVTNGTPLAVGASFTTEGDNITVTFDYELTNGAYTIVVFDGAFSGVTDWSGFENSTVSDIHAINFSITGNPMTFEKLQRHTDPEFDEVKTLEYVKVWWGNMNRLQAVSVDGIGGTMSVNGGPATPITWQIVEEEQEGIADSYCYYLKYTPAEPITKAGAYQFIINEDQVRVNTYQEEYANNDEVVITYNVQGIDEPVTGTTVQFNFVSEVEGMDAEDVMKLVTVSDEAGMTIPAEENPVVYTFENDYAYVAFTISAEYEITIAESDDTEGINGKTFEVIDGAAFDGEFNTGIDLWEGANGMVFNVTIAEAQTVKLPEPQIKVLPGGDKFTYWDAISVVWYKETDVPYSLQIVDASKITIEANGVEDLGFTAALTEVDPEEGVVFEDSNLVLTLDMLEMSNSSYVVTIPAGSVYILIDGKAYPNEEIVYKFSFTVQNAPTDLPEPTIIPANNSEVTELNTVTLSWENFVVHQRENGYGVPLKDITYTVDGGAPQVVEVSYEGDESVAFSDYYPTLVLNIDADQSGLYVITIPAEALYISNEDAGSLTNEEIVLTYTVKMAPEPTFLPAPDYYDPALNSNISEQFPDFFVGWKNVRMDIGDAAYKDLDKKGIQVYFNGGLNEMWTSWMGASLRAVNTVGSNEGEIPEDETPQDFPVGGIKLVFGDMAQFFIPEGTIRIVIPEGFVTSVDGATNKEIVLEYTHYTTDLPDPTIIPADGSELSEVPEINISWKGWGMNIVREGGELGSYVPYYPTFTVNGGEAQQAELEGENAGFGGYPHLFTNIVVKLPENTVPGTYSYVVTIPKEMLQLYDEDMNRRDLTTDLVLNYKVVIPQAAMDYVTLNISGLDHLNVINLSEGTPVDITESPYRFEFNGMTGLVLAADEGYSVTVSCDQEPSTTTYMIDGVSGMAEFTGTQLTMTLMPGAAGYEFDINVTEEETTPDMLVPEDTTMGTFFTNAADTDLVEGSINIDLNLGELDNAFAYSGFEFDIELPSFLTVQDVVLNSNIDGDISFTTQGDNVYRVIAYMASNKGVTVTNDIATINVSSYYSALAAAAPDYGVTINGSGQYKFPMEIKTVPGKSVIFSTPNGVDITTVTAGSGTLTAVVELRNPATDIAIESATIDSPSYSESTTVESVTAGENVTLDIVVAPADTTDEVHVSAVDEDGNQLPVIDNGDGTWTVDTSSLEDSLAPGEEMTVTVTVKAGDVEETYELTVRGIILGDSNDNTVSASDPIVNVADVVTTANYIAANGEDLEDWVVRFDFPNANVILNEVDGEQVINTDDVVATVSIAMGKFDGDRNPKSIRRHTRTMMSTDRLIVDNFNASKSDFTVGVGLENTSDYAALQATVIVPEGMTVKNVTTGPRAAAHQIRFRQNADGNVTLVLFSLQNACFLPGEGSLFNLEVSADDDCGAIRLTNIHATDAASNGYDLGYDGGLNETVATGLDSIETENGEVRYFTIDGIEVVNPEKGQILIRIEGDKAEKVVIK